MMNGGMDAMMGWMPVLGWLGALIVVVLLVAAIIAVVRLLNPDVSVAEASGLKILVIVFAVIGALAVLGGVAALFMHWGMRGMMG